MLPIHTAKAHSYLENCTGNTMYTSYTEHPTRACLTLWTLWRSHAPLVDSCTTALL